jgi:SOS response regulatory protein OraA/RecX
MTVDVTTGDAYEAALRALHHRDRTEFEIDEYLRSRGFSDDDRSQALEKLRRAGLVNDARFAQSRASALAERRAGNALIRARLAEAGVARELVDGALEVVDSELERARRIVQSRGVSPKTARYLHGKGFSDGVIRAVIAEGDDGELG